MKKYNIIPETIKIADLEFSGITLGEKGRGRTLVNVSCPDSEFLEVGATKTGKARLNKSTLRKGWVARVSTEGAYIRNGKGNVSTATEYAEHIKVVARGQGAFGDAGRIGSWDDLLLATELEEFWLRVKPTRGDAYILLFKSNKVTKLSYEENDLIELNLEDSTATSRGSLTQL